MTFISVCVSRLFPLTSSLIWSLADLKHDNQWYSHSTRAFHLSLVLDACEDVFGSDIKSRSESKGEGSSAPSTSTSSPASVKWKKSQRTSLSSPSTDTPNGSSDTEAQDNVLTLYHAKPFKAGPTEFIWIFKFTKPEMHEQVPFKGWIAKNGRWVRPWSKPRLNHILERWRSPNAALHRPLSAETPPSSPLEGTKLRPVRHLADAQFDLGHLTLHLLVLLRKRNKCSDAEAEEGRPPVDKGLHHDYGYDIEASLAFFV